MKNAVQIAIDHIAAYCDCSRCKTLVSEIKDHRPEQWESICERLLEIDRGVLDPVEFHDLGLDIRALVSEYVVPA